MSKKWLILGSVSFSVGLSLSLIIDKDLKQAALTGLLSIPTTTAGVLVTEYQRKQKLNDHISTKQEQLQGLIQQEAELNHSIPLLFAQVENLKQQEENISAVISNLDTDKQRYLQLATQSKSELETIQNQIYELSDRKSSLEPEVIALEIKLRQLQEQETGLAKSLVNLSSSKQQIKLNSASDRHTCQQLQEQKNNLEENINKLAKQKQTLAEQLNSQQYSLNQLQRQKLDLENAIAKIYTHKQKLDIKQHDFKTFISELNAEIENLRQQKVELHQSLLSLNLEKQGIDLSYVTSQTKLSQLQNLVLEQQQLKKKLEEELANIEPPKKPIPPKPPQPESTPNLDWLNNFEDAKIGQVFLHLYQHNSLAEAELIQMLGSPRKARSFDRNLEQYLIQVPFSVRVETTSNGKRYVKY